MSLEQKTGLFQDLETAFVACPSYLDGEAEPRLGAGTRVGDRLDLFPLPGLDDDLCHLVVEVLHVPFQLTRVVRQDDVGRAPPRGRCARHLHVELCGENKQSGNKYLVYLS